MNRLSLVFGNTLYLAAFVYYSVITFLGYNGKSFELCIQRRLTTSALPFLQHTELLLAPIPFLALFWVVSLFGFNIPRHMAPILWTGVRKIV
jgi:hypothetical protein